MRWTREKQKEVSSFYRSSRNWQKQSDKWIVLVEERRNYISSCPSSGMETDKFPYFSASKGLGHILGIVTFRWSVYFICPLSFVSFHGTISFHPLNGQSSSSLCCVCVRKIEKTTVEKKNELFEIEFWFGGRAMVVCFLYNKRHALVSVQLYPTCFYHGYLAFLVGWSLVLSVFFLMMDARNWICLHGACIVLNVSQIISHNCFKWKPEIFTFYPSL